MTDEKKVKKPSASSAAVKDSLAAFAPEIEEGTVMRFEVNFEPNEPGSHDYTYVALFVTNRWWVTGRSTVFGSGGLTNTNFMSRLGEYGAHNIELAIEFDTVR
jgi:hypothetical protein